MVCPCTVSFKNELLDQILRTAENQDRVYNWGINKYWVYTGEVNGRQMITVADLLPRMTKEDDKVVLLTHSIEGIRNASNSYPLIFLDVISEWDAQKRKIGSYGNCEWDEICQRADRVITKKELPPRWSNKKVNPFESENETEADEICFREERFMELSHYMRNEEMLCGVLSVLKAVEEAGGEE